MKKSTLMVAIGEKPPTASDDADMTDEAPESKDEGDRDADIDEAIDTALDPKEDAATRREAFRRAVKACSGDY